MNPGTLKQASTCVLVGSALAFLVVLSLHWHRTMVDVAGVTHVRADQMGWNGGGSLAGLAAIVLVTLNVRRARRSIDPDATFGITDLVLAVVILSATVAAVFGGSAEVQVGIVGVDTTTILWPAWLGLALAIVTAVSAAIVALPEAWQPGKHPTPTAA